MLDNREMVRVEKCLLFEDTWKYTIGWFSPLEGGSVSFDQNQNSSVYVLSLNELHFYVWHINTLKLEVCFVSVLWL